MELTEIEEIARIKDCSNVFEVISKHPKNIQGLLRDISSLPVTQVTAERLFSSLKFIKNDLRSSLKDGVIDNTLFLIKFFGLFNIFWTYFEIGVCSRSFDNKFKTPMPCV